MRFLLDANVPRSLIQLLLRHGHDVDHVVDIGMGNSADDEIAQHAKRINATLISRDLDFADVRRYPPSQHAGIVVLRLPDDMVAKEIVEVFDRFLLILGDPQRLCGRLAIVERNRFRLRPSLA